MKEARLSVREYVRMNRKEREYVRLKWKEPRICTYEFKKNLEYVRLDSIESEYGRTNRKFLEYIRIK